MNSAAKISTDSGVFQQDPVNASSSYLLVATGTVTNFADDRQANVTAAEKHCDAVQRAGVEIRYEVCMLSVMMDLEVVRQNVIDVWLVSWNVAAVMQIVSVVTWSVWVVMQSVWAVTQNVGAVTRSVSAATQSVWAVTWNVLAVMQGVSATDCNTKIMH